MGGETQAAPRHVLWCRRLYFMVAWPAPSRMKEAPPFASESLFLICGCERRRGDDQRVDCDERCEAAGRDLHPEICVQLVPAVDLDLLVLPVVSQPLCPLLELSCRDRACARTQWQGEFSQPGAWRSTPMQAGRTLTTRMRSEGPHGAERGRSRGRDAHQALGVCQVGRGGFQASLRAPMFSPAGAHPQ